MAVRPVGIAVVVAEEESSGKISISSSVPLNGFVVGVMVCCSSLLSETTPLTVCTSSSSCGWMEGDRDPDTLSGSRSGAGELACTGRSSIGM